MLDTHGEMRTVTVDLPDHPYNIFVQPGLLKQTGDSLRRITRGRRVGLVTDSTIAGLHGETATKSLQDAGFEVIIVTLAPGEQQKTLQNVETIFDQLLNAKFERSTPIIALGGGVIGDMTGFAAATILRGVPFVQIPTTLLAMVDASVGGKTGVNHAAGKNLIGAFHQPKAVLIDPAVLSTLSKELIQDGLAECIKHDIIRDSDGFHKLETNIQRALDLDIEYLSQLVAHNVAIKADVVETDPFETGERAHLNFGHTFGHAIETVSNYEISHGRAVALGMTAASKLATLLGMIDETALGRITALINQASLPTSGMVLDAEQVFETMAFDKKVHAGRLRFILPDRIGSAVIRDDVPEELVRAAIEHIR